MRVRVRVPWDAPKYAVCPDGEEAVLKTVGRKRLAGSNPALPTIYYILGRSQAGKAQDFDSCMLWFESRRPSHFFWWSCIQVG